MTYSTAAGALLLTMTLGCAATTYKPASSASTNGVRYYAPATYLLLKPDYKKSKVSVSILILPDTTQLYTVDTYSWLASNDTKVEFKNGMIQKSVSDTDSVKVPKAAIEGLAAVAKAVLDAAAAEAKLAAATSGAQLEKAPTDPPILLYYVDGPKLICVFSTAGCPR